MVFIKRRCRYYCLPRLFYCVKFIVSKSIGLLSFMGISTDSTPLPSQKFTFVKQQRLLNNQAFTPVFNSPSFKIHQPNILLFVKVLDLTESNAIKNSRLGLAITKKKIKRANQRNRVKRLSREYFRLHQHELSQAVDIAIIIKHFPVKITNAEIVAQLEMAFKQINSKLKHLSAKNSAI